MPSALRQQLGLPAAAPLEFDVDGETYRLPELPARTWLETLPLQPPGCWWQLIPVALDGAGGHQLYGRLLDDDDPFDLDDLEAVAVRVLGEACGTDFWAATRLAAMAYSNWMVFDGWCWTRGVDPLAQPIPRVLAAVYTWRRSLCTKESQVAAVDAEVWADPPPTTASGAPREIVLPAWSDEREAATFTGLVDVFGRRGRG